MTAHLKRICESIDNDFHIEEENVTSNLDGGEGQPKTPFAFGKSNDLENSYNTRVKDSHRFFKKWENLTRRIDLMLNEASYSDFKNDDSQSTRQKVNTHIQEINRKLREVEQMITHAHRLKQESGADQTVFWKGTLKNFNKINERLLRLSTKIREMNS